MESGLIKVISQDVVKQDRTSKRGEVAGEAIHNVECADQDVGLSRQGNMDHFFAASSALIIAALLEISILYYLMASIFLALNGNTAMFLRNASLGYFGFVAAIYLVLFAASSTFSSHGIVAASPTYNVVNYGATGSGDDDDAQAFVKAWEDTCGDSGEKGTPTLAVPGGKKFRLSPVAFKGPCKSSSINVQIDGTLVAPSSLSGWKGCSSGRWLNFQDVANLNVKGSGQVDGQGSLWWDGAKGGCEKRPTALGFLNCINLVLSGLHHVNSPRNHISIINCHNGIISNLHITAPESSPNTDGIDISRSNNLDIHDLDIQTGDDCIAINGGSSNISITRVSCGPGHGISIGSLGKNGAYKTVEQVQVRDCTFRGTTNGVRIKTWQGGSGYAKNIIFNQIKLDAVSNPIIIDQFYNPGGAQLNEASSVVVSDVSFTSIRGTSASDQAITLSCSSVGCSDITFDNVDITSSKPGDTVTASCENCHGSATLTTPPVPCLNH
ncbi:probable polygalacturonase At3g15720 [Eucalyptus grandis]|uniref:probable polygalacturonase At3g15720 n=1 Tax=Eucalyptus grandis TaxID=71139 RepID=UPI00192EDE70|nr:probable polygalacturonase At3g15720 [Eucalyptus grandis]